jgi:transaldolase/transaldolase/glucose-6-phosphate isomerase
MYVEQLIGQDTINTMPAATIEAFQDHGHVARTIDQHIEDAIATLQALGAAGISLQEVTDKLQDDGIHAFTKSLESLYTAIRYQHSQKLDESPAALAVPTSLKK